MLHTRPAASECFPGAILLCVMLAPVVAWDWGEVASVAGIIERMDKYRVVWPLAVKFLEFACRILEHVTNKAAMKELCGGQRGSSSSRVMFSLQDGAMCAGRFRSHTAIWRALGISDFRGLLRYLIHGMLHLALPCIRTAVYIEFIHVESGTGEGLRCVLAILGAVVLAHDLLHVVTIFGCSYSCPWVFYADPLERDGCVDVRGLLFWVCCPQQVFLLEWLRSRRVVAPCVFVVTNIMWLLLDFVSVAACAVAWHILQGDGAPVVGVLAVLYAWAASSILMMLPLLYESLCSC